MHTKTTNNSLLLKHLEALKNTYVHGSGLSDNEKVAKLVYLITKNTQIEPFDRFINKVYSAEPPKISKLLIISDLSHSKT